MLNLYIPDSYLQAEVELACKLDLISIFPPKYALSFNS